MDVVVAVITDDQQRVLITRRPLEVPFGGLWEFPGGKIKSGEEAAVALSREIFEEVGLEVITYRFLSEISYHYSEHEVTLLVYHVTRFTGIATSCESQLDLQWVDPTKLQDYEFPSANGKIIELIAGALYG